MGEAELLNGLGAAIDAGALIAIPEGEIADGRILDLRSRHRTAALQDISEIGLVGGADVVGYERLQDRRVIHRRRRRLDGRRNPSPYFQRERHPPTPVTL